MYKIKRKGFVGVELLIIASIIMGAGLLGIASMGEKGHQAITNGIGKLDILGVLGNSTDKVIASGYPNGLEVFESSINAEGDFSFQWDEALNGWAVTEYLNNTKKEVVVPAQLSDGNKVVRIGDSAFTSKSITSIVLPDSIIEIGTSSFRSNLISEIVWPSSLTALGDSAFRANQLESLEVPNGISSIGQDTFRANRIKTLVFSSNLTSIGMSAFAYNQLTSLFVPDWITTISEDAFFYNNLTSLTLGKNLSSIGQRAFGSNQLVSVSLKGPRPAELGNFIFQGSSGLTEGTVLVPSEHFWDYKNSGAADRFSLYHSNRFGILEGDENLEGGLGYQWNNTFNGWEVIAYSDWANKDIVIPETRADGLPVVSVRASAFLNAKLSSVVLPTQLKSIGASAFEGNLLTNVILPVGLTELPGNSFRNNNITDVVIPDSVTLIGNYVFLNNSLTSLVIPNGVTSVGIGAFSGNKLETLVVGNKVSSINPSAFANNKLTSVTFLGARPTLPAPSGAILSNNPTLSEGSVVVPAAHLANYQASAASLGVPVEYIVGN